MTSTMGTMAPTSGSGPGYAYAYACGPNKEQSSTISTGNRNATNKRKGFSTAVQTYGEIDLHSILQLSSNFANTSTSTNTHNEDMPTVFGKELELSQAVAVQKSKDDVFDKILLLVGHGDASFVTEEQSKASFGGKEHGNFCLTAQGIGEALKTSGKTANFCNNQTELIPELFIISPIRSCVETALLSFPYYTPHSIQGTKWVYHPGCHDKGSDSDYVESIEDLEKAFPAIEDVTCSAFVTSGEQNNIDFLSWLETREEKVIAISSTPSWVESFCDSIEPGHGSKDLRAVGIKFSS